jgi:pimeloyl-ACP methyl ester carboxylesterase
MARPDSRADLVSNILPVLVLVGSDDALTPPSIAEEMAALIPNARLTILPGAGHLTPLEAPGEVTAALLQWFNM